MRCISRFREQHICVFSASHHFFSRLSTTPEKPSASTHKLQQIKEQARIRSLVKSLQHQASSRVDVKIYGDLLRACSKAKALAEGQQVHAHIAKSRYAHNTFLRNLLIHMYGKCGCLEEARRLFHGIHSKDVVSWTTIIAAHSTLHEHCTIALKFFRQMQLEGVRPNKVTLTTALAACTNPAALAEGRHIHALATEFGVEWDVIIATALVKMYGRCGSLEDAFRVFWQMPERNVISWTTMISACIQHERQEDALGLFEQMQLSGLKPNKVTYLSLLNACSSLLELARGKLIHNHIIKSGYEVDLVLGTALVDTYGKCGSLKDALETFHSMAERNVVTWTVLISAYAHHGHQKQVLHFFDQMQREGFKPNTVTVVTVLHACADMVALEDGIMIHGWIIENGLAQNTVVCTALIDLYGKCGRTPCAIEIFDSMLERDLVTWNTMINAYLNNGQSKGAFMLFQQMQLEGMKPNKISFVSALEACSCPTAPIDGTLIHDQIRCDGLDIDVVVGSALVNMYGNSGRPMEARGVFEALPVLNVVAWTAMISAYAQNGHSMEAIQLFHEMRIRGLKPNKFTILSVLDACTNAAFLQEGELIHACIDGTDLESDDLVGTALVHMYRKCGCLSDARKAFDKVADRSVVLWTVIIAAYAQHGNGKEAVQLFGRMQWEGLKVDEIVLVSLLSACSHTGMIDEGSHYFLSFATDSGIRPTIEHYGCMIDLFGRAGHLDEAEKIIRGMPVKADSVMFMALLGACRIYKDVGRGRRIAEELLELDPKNVAVHVMLSNIYAASGRWDHAKTIRYMIPDRYGHSVSNSKKWLQSFHAKREAGVKWNTSTKDIITEEDLRATELPVLDFKEHKEQGLVAA